MREKATILGEIRRTAEDNDGVPLGERSFTKATGIGAHEWRGRHWSRWSEALLEAGYAPNQKIARLDDEYLLARLVEIVRKLGRYPTTAELGLEKVQDPTIPHAAIFRRRLGTEDQRLSRVRAYVTSRPELAEVLALLPAFTSVASEPESAQATAPTTDGAVYMLRLGKHYKIGKSFRVPQRHREIAIELPEKPDVVHVITTDDPAGIETYWHKRFSEKRTNGEWFTLGHEDVRAFKRRRFM